MLQIDGYKGVIMMGWRVEGVSGSVPSGSWLMSAPYSNFLPLLGVATLKVQPCESVRLQRIKYSNVH